ncbi:MAG: putative lipoprotein precursor [Flaviaesturariibacter sp.]|nr:putative lipoprotein precursor [Flaviaesturariibacter sp.]
MKKILFSYSAFLLMLSVISCDKKEGISDDLSFLNSAASSNVNKIFDISTDNSGNVKITPTGEGVSSFTVNYGHGTGANASAVVMPGNSTTHSYPEGSYTVSIVAKDIAGKETTTTYPLQVTYRAPQNVMITTNADMAVSATALYAKSFLVYYGDVANEVGTPLAIGQTLPAHIYPAGTSTPYTLRVVALSGGAATTTATKALFGFPIDFETAAVDYFFGTFGNVNFSKVANPSATGLNTSAMVGKYEKPSNAESWSGTYSPLNIPINLAHGKKVKVLVYNPNAANIGKKLNIELEAAVAGTGATSNGVGVIKMPLTTFGAWEELVFDFGTIAAIPATARFNQLVLRFNDIAGGSGEVIYIDNIRITN